MQSQQSMSRFRFHYSKVMARWCKGTGDFASLPGYLLPGRRYLYFFFQVVEVCPHRPLNFLSNHHQRLMPSFSAGGMDLQD